MKRSWGVLTFGTSLSFLLSSSSCVGGVVWAHQPPYSSVPSPNMDLSTSCWDIHALLNRDSSKINPPVTLQLARIPAPGAQMQQGSLSSSRHCGLGAQEVQSHKNTYPGSSQHSQVLEILQLVVWGNRSYPNAACEGCQSWM